MQLSQILSKIIQLSNYVQGKKKRTGMRFGQRSDWKKAYVTLKEGSELDFVGGAE